MTNGKADNHEAIDWYRPVENPDKTKPVWGENQWPSVPGFKEKYEIWMDKMKKSCLGRGCGMTRRGFWE